MRAFSLNAISLLVISLFLAACSKGGNLTLEPGARIVKSKGTPSLRINQGGKALVVEQGKTPANGVHGWVTVNSVSGRNVTSVDGTNAVFNKPSTGN